MEGSSTEPQLQSWSHFLSKSHSLQNNCIVSTTCFILSWKHLVWIVSNGLPPLRTRHLSVCHRQEPSGQLQQRQFLVRQSLLEALLHNLWLRPRTYLSGREHPLQEPSVNASTWRQTKRFKRHSFAKWSNLRRQDWSRHEKTSYWQTNLKQQHSCDQKLKTKRNVKRHKHFIEIAQ